MGGEQRIARVFALAAARVAAQRAWTVAPAALRAVAAGPPPAACKIGARIHAAACPTPRAWTLRPPSLARQQQQQQTTDYTRRLLTTTPKPAPTAGQRAVGAAATATRTLLRAAASATATTLRSGAVWLGRYVPASASALANALRSPGSARRAWSLRVAAWWRAHGAKVAFAGGGILAYGVWRGATALATALGGVSETRVALAVAALAALAALVTRARLALSPDTVHARAFARFNRDPGVLEVLDPPLASGGPRAAVESGGGWRVAPGSLVPTWAPRRVVMSFPLAGSERRGVASVEAVKRSGAIKFKFLAVDVPTPAGGDARLVLEGEADRAASLADALRPPLVRAVALGRAHAAEDAVDDAADAAAAAAVARAAAAEATLAEGKKGRRAAWWQPWLRPW